MEDILKNCPFAYLKRKQVFPILNACNQSHRLLEIFLSLNCHSFWLVFVKLMLSWWQARVNSYLKRTQRK